MAGFPLSLLQSHLLHTGALWSDSEQSDDIRHFLASNRERTFPPEQSNGIYYATPLNTHQEAVQLGICVQLFSVQCVVGYVGASGR